MRRKSFMAVVAVLSVFLLGGVALAADLAEIKVTSEPIRALSLSDKAGGLSFTFDAGTTLNPGDQITGDLPLNVTLAKEIDLVVSDGVDMTDPANPVYSEIGTFAAAPLLAESPTVVAVAGSAYFRVYGAVGSQRVTIDVMGTGITVGDDTTLTLFILGQRVYGTPGDTAPASGAPGLYIQGTTPGAYDVVAGLADNTLCINVSQYEGEFVRMSFDSRGDKFTFNPSNPQIAHVTQPLAISFDECKGREVGRLVLGEVAGQSGTDSCAYFDTDTDIDGTGYCTETHFANRMIIKGSTPFDLASYTVGLEILVNGQPGDNGVYWTNQAVGVDGYNTLDDACAAGNPAALVPLSGSYQYFLASGSAATAAAPATGDCDVAAENRAVELLSPVSELGLATGNDYMIFDLPAMNYDLDEINDGDVVTVKVTINKVPCGTLFEGTWEIGTFGCIAAGFSTNMTFPYYTPIATGADGYWDGFVVTNLGGTDGEFSVVMYEADGDVGTVGPIPVAARSQYVNLLSLVLPLMTQTGGTGVLGDSTCYLYVTSDFNMDGFAMMADPTSGESMGYLPRLPMAPVVVEVPVYVEP